MLGPDTTPFAGNLALGAVDDPDLTRRVAAAMGAEVRAFTAGLGDAGAIACAKHFPDKDDATVDSHHDLPVLAHDLDHLRDVELVPFRAALAAGAGMVMSSHAAYPAVTGRGDLPATLSAAVLDVLRRGELGFAGVTVTGAIDMKALGQGDAQVVDAVVALQAVSRGMLGAADLRAAAARITELAVTTTARPDLDVVGCGARHLLAAEVARRAATLLRDPGGVLPLPTDSRVQPAPFDRTPADTSSTVTACWPRPSRRCASVDAHVVDAEPSRGENDAVVPAAADADVVVVGLVDGHAHPPQLALVGAAPISGRLPMTLGGHRCGCRLQVVA